MTARSGPHDIRVAAAEGERRAQLGSHREKSGPRAPPAAVVAREEHTAVPVVGPRRRDELRTQRQVRLVRVRGQYPGRSLPPEQRVPLVHRVKLILDRQQPAKGVLRGNERVAAGVATLACREMAFIRRCRILSFLPTAEGR